MLDLLLHQPGSDAVAARVLDARESLHAPYLLDLEVAQVLRRYAVRGELTPRRGQEALDLLAAFPLFRYPHEPLLPRIWRLRANLTAYDAAYVALAEGLDAPLLTRDRRLSNTTGHRATVELI